MTNDRALATYQSEQPHELTLPDSGYLRRELQAVRDFQNLAHELLVNGSDYGVIPGTDKPTLLKPGAEKIAKLLGLADNYEILDKVEDWDRPLFRYVIRCHLISVRSGVTVSTGLGECNSYESRYRWRWVFESELPAGVDKATLVTKQFRRKNGNGTFMKYRMENEDIYSQVNTIMKMAAKRALVSAALSAGRLSEVFTQDMEDVTASRDEDDAPEAPAARQQARNNAGPAPRAQGRPQVVDVTPTRAEDIRGMTGYPQTPAPLLAAMNVERIRLGWTGPQLAGFIKDTHGGRGPRDLTEEEAKNAVNALGVMSPEPAPDPAAAWADLDTETAAPAAPSGQPSAGAAAIMAG